jgi:hypothetical protein
METLLEVRHLTRKGDYMFSFDLEDGFYAMGIRHQGVDPAKKTRVRTHESE